MRGVTSSNLATQLDSKCWNECGGILGEVAPLHVAHREFIAAHNEAPKPFVWAKTADQILASIARYAQRTLAAQSQQLISRTIGTGD